MRLLPGPALAAWAAAAGLCASALAPAPAAARPADLRPTSPSTVVVAWSAMPAGTDPLVTDDQYSTDIEALLYDPLYYETPGRAYAPDLARTWQVGAGGRTYTYVLNPKARWSDGRPVRAADVVSSLRAYASPRDTGAEAGRFGDLLSARAMGAETVRVRLRRPDPAWPGLVAGLPILPAPVPAPSARRGAAPAPPAVTDGPYAVRRWDAQTGLVSLAANPAYFRGAPHVARIEVRVVPSPAATLAGLRRGTVQVAVLPPGWAQVVRRTAGLTGHAVDGAGVALIAFNVARTPLRQAAVRRALALAVDRPALIRAAGPAGAVVPPGPWPAALGGAAPTSAAFDPALARRLLAAAGWRLGKGGVRRRDGRPLALSLRYPATAPALARAVAYVAESWRRVGVGVRLVPAPFAALTASAAAGAYQALALGAAFGGGAALGALLGGRAAFPPRGEDVARYANPLVTALLLSDGQGAAEAAPPPAVLDALAALLAEGPPYLPLWSDTSLVVTSATLSNFVANPWGPDLYQAQRWIVP